MAQNHFGKIDNRTGTPVTYNFTPLSSAEPFSTSKPYAVGDYVFYEGVLYRCKTDKAAGAWAPTKFEEANLGEHLTEAEKALLTKAEIDGYYDGMTVGNAEQIVGTVFEEDDTAYNYRTTGGSAEVGDRAYVESVTGGSLVWNQIFAPERLVATYTYNGLTFTNNGDGSMTITGTAEQNGQGRIAPSVVIPKGHKYFFFVSNLVGSDTTFQWSFWANNGADYILNSNNGYILREMGSTHDNVGVWINVKSGITYNMTIKPNVFDLTAMFGSTIADYIYALETAHAGDGVAWFKRYFPKPYYAYHAVGMEHVNAVSAKTVGFNQWDEEWELGQYSASTGEKTASTLAIRCKNKIPVFPNTSYYFQFPRGSMNCVCFYDADEAFISGSAVGFGASQAWSTPPNAHYMAFQMNATYGVTYTNDINISIRWDNSRDGDYEPYNLHTYPLADLTLRGVPLIDESGNLKFDGDRYLPDGTVENLCEEVTIAVSNVYVRSGNPNCDFALFQVPYAWYQGLNGFPVLIGEKVMQNTNGWDTINVIGAIIPYDTNSRTLAAAVPKGTTVAEAKALFDGTKMVYRIATPTTEEADPYQYPMVVDNWGTEEFVDGLVESGDRDVAIPVGHETKYPPNLKDKLESAANNPDADGVYVLTHDGGSNTYTPLASNATIQNIIARLEALEGGGDNE